MIKVNEISVEDLAYHLKQASDRDLSKPIFFLGAGASFSGKIPLASGVETVIKDSYADNPNILRLADNDKTYSKLMGCLNPIQRNELLCKLIEDAKINVTHIYLAQLIEKNLVDYVLTTNFDNLMLRALALFDIFPPVYDLTSISDFTTTTIKDKSVVYLHGQHNGNWLLNTDEEMAKVKAIIPRIFDTIKNQRPWIFIGYSGNDPIFEHIKSLGRFDNGLYWVGHDNYMPSGVVQEFLSKPNSNAYFIKGYDSDAFMIKLNNALGLAQPEILDKPFSSLKGMLSNIVDIDDKEHFRGVKERLEIALKNVDQAIAEYETVSKNINKTIKEDMSQGGLGKPTIELGEGVSKELQVDRLKREIISLITSGSYDENRIISIENKAIFLEDDKVNNLIAALNYEWANSLSELAERNLDVEAEQLYLKSIDKYKKAVEIIPDFYQALYNWAHTLLDLAKIKSKDEAENYYQQANDIHECLFEIDPLDYTVHFGWGTSLAGLAKTKSKNEAEKFYKEALKKYERASGFSPNNDSILFNWGNALVALAELKSGLEAEKLYKAAFDKYAQAVDISPNNANAYNNWGLGLTNLALIQSKEEAERTFERANSKYKEALKTNPSLKEAKCNLGGNLSLLASRKTGVEAEGLYKQAIDIYKEIIDLYGDNYDALHNWADGLLVIAHTRSGKEAEHLYQEACEKFNNALRVKPNSKDSLYGLGNSLYELAKNKSDLVAEHYYRKAVEKLLLAHELGSGSYNLACCYALLNDKRIALEYLDKSLKNDEVLVDHVLQDEDWKGYLEDEFFKEIISNYT